MALNWVARLSQGVAQGPGEGQLFVICQESAQLDELAAGPDDQPTASCVDRLNLYPRPIGFQHRVSISSAGVVKGYLERIHAQPHVLALPRGGVADPKGEIDQKNIDPEKAQDRPGADQGESDAYRDTDPNQTAHDQDKSQGWKTSMRAEHGLE